MVFMQVLVFVEEGKLESTRKPVVKIRTTKAKLVKRIVKELVSTETVLLCRWGRIDKQSNLMATKL